MNTSHRRTIKYLRTSRRRALAIGKHGWRAVTRWLTSAVSSHAAWSAASWQALYQPSTRDDEL